MKSQKSLYEITCYNLSGEFCRIRVRGYTSALDRATSARNSGCSCVQMTRIDDKTGCRRESVMI